MMLHTFLKHFIVENAIEVFFENLITNCKTYNYSCKGADLTPAMHGLMVTVTGHNLHNPLRGIIKYPRLDNTGLTYKSVRTSHLPHLTSIDSGTSYGIIEEDDIISFDS